MNVVQDPLVAIIVLNWNGAQDTLDCLRSLDRVDYPNYRVVVVDNGSQDDSLKLLEEYARSTALVPEDVGRKSIASTKGFVKYSRTEALRGDGVEAELDDAKSEQRLVVLRNEANLGFSEGNNVALRYVTRSLHPDYVLLLNNDTIVEPGFLSKLVRAAESNSDIGVIGPQIRPWSPSDGNGKVAFCGGRIEWLVYPGYLHIRGYAEASAFGWRNGLECDWITGTAMMLRSECLRYGLLDNDYFFGCEDVDLSIRLRKKGYRIVILLDSIIYHKGGKSRRKRYPEEVRRIVASALTNFRFVRKNAPLYPAVMAIHSLQLAAILAKTLGKLILRR